MEAAASRDDLPEPDGPVMAVMTPGMASKFTQFNAVMVRGVPSAFLPSG